jgi:HK97 family phage major capsid protein
MKYAESLRAEVAKLAEERATLKAEAAELVVDETRDAAAVDARADEIIERSQVIKADIAAKEARATELEAIDAERAAAPRPTIVNATQSSNSDLYDLEGNRSASPRDLIARARTAVERNEEAAFTDAQREAVTEKLSRNNKHTAAIAEYVLQTGSPEYQAEFERFLATQGRSFGPLLERTAMSLTTANGGAMVPYILDPSVMLTNAGVANPVRQLARVETIAGATEWRGVTSAGVTAEWLAEGSQAADASPTFAQPAIPTFKGAAYLFGSYEVLADSGFAGQVQGLIVDAKDRLEGTAFTTGNGSTAPQGFITGKVAAGSLVASSTTDALLVADVYATQAGLAPRFRNSSAAFLANVSIINRIRQFDTGGGSSLWAQLGAGQPSTLLGSSIYETSDMDGTLTALGENYVLAYGDWKQAYVIVDRIGVEVYYDNLVMGANQRPTGQAGFFAFWRTGGEVVVPEAISLLNVT